MDRVFDNPSRSTRQSSPNNRQLVPVEVAVHEPIQPLPHPITAQVAPQAAPHMAAQGFRWQTPLLTGIAVAGLMSSGWLLFDLQRSARTLERERNVALVERLRATEKAIPPTAEPATVDRLEPLTLPIQSLPMPPIGLAPSETTPISPLPVLTGVMQSPGGRSSAIFQINNASVSAEIGESLGSSGWTLASVGTSSAVIRNNGQERTLSVGGVF